MENDENAVYGKRRSRCRNRKMQERKTQERTQQEHDDVTSDVCKVVTRSEIATVFTAWMKRETTERRTAKLHKEGAYKMHRNVVPRFGRFYVLGRVHLIDIGDIGYWGTCGLDFQQFIFFS